MHMTATVKNGCDSQLQMDVTVSVKDGCDSQLQMYVTVLKMHMTATGKDVHDSNG